MISKERISEMVTCILTSGLSQAEAEHYVAEFLAECGDGWIPVSERLPKTANNVFVMCQGWNDSGFQVCHHNRGRWQYDEQPNEMFDGYVTHWKPINPPEDV